MDPFCGRLADHLSHRIIVVKVAKAKHICTNPIICREHGNLVSLGEHVYNLWRAFIAENPYDIDPIRDWFQIASGIISVSYDSARFDDNYFYCGTAIEYETKKSKFHEQILLQLTLFTYIWGGFEAFVDSLNLTPCPKQKGKINAVSYYLSSHYDVNERLDFYDDLLNLLMKYIALNPWYGEVGDLFKLAPCNNDITLGLKVVYKIRNLFAHGALKFSEPEEWNSTKPYDVRIVHISSRIILLTIQMIFYNLHKDAAFRIDKKSYSGVEGTISSNNFLKKLHLRTFKY